MAAALSTADGLLLAIANALSHDIYYKMLDPNAPTICRLTVARVLLFFVAVASAALAATKPGDILAMVGWAFSLAMAGNFPVIVMGIWWKRATTPGAIAGMIAGFGLCLFYLVVSRYYPGIGVKFFGMTSLLNPVTGKPVIPDLAAAMALPNAMESWPTLAHPLANKVGWFNLNNINCGLLGMPLGFLVIYVVSLMTKAPSKEMQAFIDEICKPRGGTVLQKKDLIARDHQTSAGPLRAPLFFRHLPQLACRRVPRRSFWSGLESNDLGRLEYPFHALVFSPAELRSGGADVHAARASGAGTDRPA